MARPTKFDPLYCDMVVEHMKEGASLTSFAAEIDVCRATINVWMKDYPEFLEACARAKAKCAAWWEKTNRTLAATGMGNQGACKLGLTNMAGDDWKDVSRQEQTGPSGGPIEKVSRIELVPVQPVEYRPD